MEVINKDEFDKAEELPEIEKNKESVEIVSEAEFTMMLSDMDKPVEELKRAALNMKLFLDKRIKTEMEENGFLSDFVRRWMKDYTDCLEKIQKAVYGDKNVSLHLHSVTHSNIASKMRKYKQVKEKNDSVIEASSSGSEFPNDGSDSSKV